MQTIGQLLQSLRQKQQLTIADISLKTKIAPHLIQFLETDDFQHLPASTFTKGFISTYAKVVGLSPEKALAVFRRDFMVTQSGKIMPKGLAKPLDKDTIITSKMIIITVVSCAIFTFLAYIGYQLKNFHAPPTIEIIRPNINAVVRGPIIPIKGFVSADSSVFVQDQLVEIFPTGEFRTTIQLPSGNQMITIKAINRDNQTTSVQIPVTVVDN